MIELLILYKLSKKVLTMYGISKDIHEYFSVLTTPSFGTIKPALTRLEKSEFIKSQKTLSAGGRPSVYYSITQKGLNETLLPTDFLLLYFSFSFFVRYLYKKISMYKNNLNSKNILFFSRDAFLLKELYALFSDKFIQKIFHWF